MTDIALRGDERRAMARLLDISSVNAPISALLFGNAGSLAYSDEAERHMAANSANGEIY